jgi:hypothetical protein
MSVEKEYGLYEFDRLVACGKKVPGMVICVLKQNPLLPFPGVMRVSVCNQAFNGITVIQLYRKVMDLIEFDCGDAPADNPILDPIGIDPFIIMLAVQLVPGLIIECCYKKISFPDYTAEPHCVKHKMIAEDKLEDIRFTSKLNKSFSDQLMNKGLYLLRCCHSQTLHAAINSVPIPTAADYQKCVRNATRTLFCRGRQKRVL